jgi:hypothetical protein
MRGRGADEQRRAVADGHVRTPRPVAP